MSNFTLTREQLDTSSSANCLSTYRFGSGVAEHFFCNHCGIFTFVKTRLNPGKFRVNLGCINEIQIDDLEISDYDGINL